MFSVGLCGHFALGTLLETWLKEFVFETSVQTPTYSDKYKNPNKSNLTPKSKKVSYPDIILSRLTHFDTW